MRIVRSLVAGRSSPSRIGFADWCRICLGGRGYSVAAGPGRSQPGDHVVHALTSGRPSPVCRTVGGIIRRGARRRGRSVRPFRVTGDLTSTVRSMN